MPKRKAVDAPTAPEQPAKRVTRANTSLAVTQPVANAQSPSKRRGRPPGIPANAVKTDDGQLPTYIKKKIRARSPTTSSLKENVRFEVDEREGDVDEINLSNDEERPAAPARRSQSSRQEVVGSATPLKARSVAQEHKAPKRVTKHTATARLESETSTTNALPSDATAKSPSKTALGKRPQLVLPNVLPPHLSPYIESQKQACLAALSNPPFAPEGEDEVNALALKHLTDLMTGTVERGEGNSCLVMGPAGSGKTRVFEKALSQFNGKSVVIRLSGSVQHSDRLAMREIARQVVQQTGSEKFSALPTDEENPFLDDVDPSDSAADGHVSLTLPPASHLPSLIAQLSSLSLPVIVLLDEFHLFTGHPRQALLYCLLDAVQSCRTGMEGQRGLSVIGLTARVDVINLLEKRVKSRFSHRILRTAGMASIDYWKNTLSRCLLSEPDEQSSSSSSSIAHRQEWERMWSQSVAEFLDARTVSDTLKDVFGLTKDFRIVQRAITRAVSSLRPSLPFLKPSQLQTHLESQRCLSKAAVLSRLNYPLISLLIAAEHIRVSGHDTFTFEMLYDGYRKQVRMSSAAPVLLGGISVGMVNVPRSVLVGSFEQLAQMGLFVPTMAPSAGLAKQFVKHRCTVEREDLRIAVDKTGITNLKKWFSKAQ